MKLVILIAGLLLAISAVNAAAVPMDMDEMMADTLPGLDDVIEDNSTAIEDNEDDEEPTDQFLAELNEYIEEQKSQKSHSRVARHATAVVYHESTVALQSHVLSKWLGCPGTPCNGRTCPRMYMTGNDWNRCGGETFQIYRQAGSGSVRVGDIVGLHYGGGTWLGCPGNDCERKSCPGFPNAIHGFSSADKWFQCGGEVFRIYAYAKANGATINSGDFIGLYYLNQQRWVSLSPNGSATKRPCLGTSRPPSTEKFDTCGWEHFRLWKR